ncbi:uncharacterized protein K452DRAFT_284861 [Aplosporella prunicola CBS 121167]|uniref:Cyanovirin-N domain-containing protein n=1 Tax=Aplosporella prunicola CBS 121167 TaxID=1176127 RepID=A0A6A6BLI9_9PEZI|nr:uncharacterized protein K452DRAFT_284861 [Aplosporella prunicola CBS 121167]KAF2144538.1 hypothetical protein K452DRAFT_284861 [Aplosporella prunicola CBS 121167]
MSFHASAQDIRVENGHWLKARLAGEGHHDHHDADLDLNRCIGNIDGHFQWGAQGFSESARNISFHIEGGANVPVLRAELRDQHGNWQARDINLAERIQNRNGHFHFE